MGNFVFLYHWWRSVYIPKDPTLFHTTLFIRRYSVPWNTTLFHTTLFIRRYLYDVVTAPQSIALFQCLPKFALSESPSFHFYQKSPSNNRPQSIALRESPSLRAPLYTITAQFDETQFDEPSLTNRQNGFDEMISSSNWVWRNLISCSYSAFRAE